MIASVRRKGAVKKLVMSAQSSLRKNKRCEPHRKPETKMRMFVFVDWPVPRCFRSCHKSICRFVSATPGRVVVEIALAARVSLAAMGVMFDSSCSIPKPIDPVWSS